MLCLMLLLLLGPAHTRSQTVCATGCDYTSIAEATSDVPGGSTILVRQGVYTETGIRLGGQFAHRIISEAPNEPGKEIGRAHV